MQSPAKIDLYADRNILFQQSAAFFDEDFTGGSFAMKVRPVPDAAALAISLATTSSSTAEGVRLVYAGTDTIANHIAALRITEAQAKANAQAKEVGYDPSTSIALSVVSIRILAGYPASEPGDNLNLAYDLIITPASGNQDKYMYGAFIVRGTVTY
jgi:FlaG/FlaF family flagellin (archaellin)